MLHFQFFRRAGKTNRGCRSRRRHRARARWQGLLGALRRRPRRRRGRHARPGVGRAPWSGCTYPKSLVRRSAFVEAHQGDRGADLLVPGRAGAGIPDPVGLDSGRESRHHRPERRPPEKHARFRRRAARPPRRNRACASGGRRSGGGGGSRGRCPGVPGRGFRRPRGLGREGRLLITLMRLDDPERRTAGSVQPDDLATDTWSRVSTTATSWPAPQGTRSALPSRARTVSSPGPATSIRLSR